jgi:hypothetical protein
MFSILQLLFTILNHFYNFFTINFTIFKLRSNTGQMPALVDKNAFN